MTDDTYKRPTDGWTCFHCGERFTSAGGAALHFGAVPDKTPGCMIKVKTGDERGLLMEIRKLELERDELQVRVTALRLGVNEDECIERFRAYRS